MDELLPHFDWNLFFTIWGMKSHDTEEARKLKDEAIEMIRRMKQSDECVTTLCARFDACHAEGDDIVAKEFRLPMLRQPGGHSLADFVAPKEYGFDSPMGMFAISVHSNRLHEAHQRPLQPPSRSPDMRRQFQHGRQLRFSRPRSPGRRPIPTRPFPSARWSNEYHPFSSARLLLRSVQQ